MSVPNPNATPHRIISLLPSVTEILFALSAGPEVVAVTHECDHPPQARSLPPVTRSLLPPSLSAADIDVAVTASLKSDAHTIYALDNHLLASLSPTVIVTQSLCAVCAVPQTAVDSVACSLPSPCAVVASDPHTLLELYDAVRHIAQAIGRQSEAEHVVSMLQARLSAVRAAVPSLHHPRVAVLEWPDPPFAPGHWVPDQITEAGGICVLGQSGKPSERITWAQMQAAQADFIVCAFCGWDLERNCQEVDKLTGRNEWELVRKHSVVIATDANSLFSRPGVRLVDGVELLAYVMHRIPALRPKRTLAALQGTDGWTDLADL